MNNLTDLYYYFRYKFSISRIWERIGIWFSYWKVTKKVYDFDYSGILELEQHQLKRLYKSIEHYQNHLYAWHDLLWIKRCINLLNIILDKDDWYDIDTGEVKFIPLENGLYEMTSEGHTKYTFKKYVNTHNYRRFLPEYPEYLQKHDTFIVTVRDEKAWNLYCRIRQNYLRNFWD